ncbi:MAG: Phenylacetaldehyde dehydrogenase [Pseudomonas citronellolis]|nr:MAG: Phenylacetaldehyde dehydrogenase [Pseudomonas citronellolis]
MKIPSVLPQVKALLEQGNAHFIDGRLLKHGNTYLEVYNPADEQMIACLRNATTREVDLAVHSAARAFARTWKRFSPQARQQCLLNLAQALAAHREELAQIEALCGGKLIDTARSEVDMSCAFLRHFAGCAAHIVGEHPAQVSLPETAASQCIGFTRREPLGVVAAVTPWNFPIMIAIWKIGAALACGCTIVVKPSEYTPLSILRIAQIAHEEAGLPAGVFNVINGNGASGEALVSHALVNKISFTGSMRTGASIGQVAVRDNLKRFTLELGGKNPAAFFADVDPEAAVDGIILAGLQHQGQVCAAAERFYVHKSLLEPVLEHLSERLGHLRIGAPLDPASQFGPLANRPHFEKILGCFDTARYEGDEIICGGCRVGQQGFFVEPTVIRARSRESSLMHQETFGPILTFLPFDSDSELLELMNDTPYGLTASLWTKDIGRAMRLVPEINAGTVWVNTHNALDPALPFGGMKGSGMGREFGNAFIEAYTELKTVVMNV